jgi:hypothetical protein
MFTKTILTTAIVLGTASAALAGFNYDGNLANRYPHLAGPAATTQAFQSAPVALIQGRNVALSGSQAIVAPKFDREGGNVDGGTSR